MADPGKAKPHSKRAPGARSAKAPGKRGWAPSASDRQGHKPQAVSWVVSHLSGKYGVRPSKISMADRLKDWGFSDEKDFAALAGDFNRDAADHSLWHNTDIAPPHLIAGVKNGTLGDLASFLAAQTSRSAPASPTVPGEPAIERFLYGEFKKLHPHADLKTKFGSINLNVSEGEINVVASYFQAEYSLDIANLLADSVRHKNPAFAIPDAAEYISEKLRGVMGGLQ